MSGFPHPSAPSSRGLLVLALALGGLLVTLLVSVLGSGDRRGEHAALRVDPAPTGARDAPVRGGSGPSVAAGRGGAPGTEVDATPGGSARRVVESAAPLEAAEDRFPDPVPWEGVVLEEEEEEPIAGVEVSLSGGPYVARATTDDEGRFRLGWSAGLDASLALAHPAYVDLRRPSVRLDEPGRFFLRPSARIEGTVRGRFEREEARIRAWRQTASSRRFWEPLASDVEADGTFTLADLSPGDYAVTALVPGCYVGLEMGIHVENGETAEVVLEVWPGASLFGRVTRQDTHGALPGVALRIEPRTEGLPEEIRGARTRETVTAADGTYEFTGLAPGIQRLHARTPWGAERREEIHIPASGDRVEHDLGLAGPARLAGWVVDGEGRGAPGATVVVLARADPRVALALLERGLDERTPRTTAGAGGAFGFDHLPAGRSLLVVAFPPGAVLPGPGVEEGARGLPGLRVVKGIEPGEERRDVEVKLPPAFEVGGTVRSGDGQPLAEAVVQAEYTVRKRTVRAVRTTTDAAGRFLLRPVRRGEFVVRASHAEHLSQAQSVRVEEGETLELAFVLEPCLLVAGVALDEQGFAVPHLPIGLRLDPEYTVPPEHAERRTRRGASTDADGRFRIEGLFDAPWRVVGGSFEWEMTGADPAVLVPSREDFTTVTFAPRDRPERFAITGRVGLREGGVPTGVRLEGLHGGVLEVDGGAFLASGLTPTRHRLRVFADGHVPRTVGPIDPVPGGTVDVGLIDLYPATQLTVRVVNEGGKAVDGARVFLVPLAVPAGGMGEEGRRIDLAARKRGKYRADFVPRFTWRLVVQHPKYVREGRTVRVGEGPRQSMKVKLKRKPG